MSDIEFTTIQNTLRNATREPQTVPAELMERTALRCEAVVAGREARKMLQQESEIPAQEVYELTAACVLGNLAMRKPLPEGSKVPDLIRRLAAFEGLQRQLDGTAKNALLCLDSGILLRAPHRMQENPNRAVQMERKPVEPGPQKGGQQR